ncbi:MAG TPA: hypothetical protein VKU40_13050, partial [Thermoanaerobaculia bacterium]|nr:hypothetical protein [Thermoanaerobaculia bacterium]
PTRTGRVVASSVRSPYFVDPRFELTVGVGELGIPLSPDAIVLPELANDLPPALVDEALALVGLAFSLAEAPVETLANDLPRLDLHTVDGRVYRLGQAGRHVRLGEETFDALAVLAAEWGGAGSDGEDWEWDRLRRSTDKGGRVAAAFAAGFAAEAAATSPRATFERFAATTAYLGPIDGALAVGDGARVELASRTSGLRVSRDGLDPARQRTLPYADLYDLDGAEMAWVAVPEEGGYQARLTYPGGGSADLHLLVADDDGDLRRVSWYGVSLGAGGLAIVDFTHADGTFTLYVDSDGDGIVDQQPSGALTTLAPRPFSAISAIQRATLNSGHGIEILFSHEVDVASLVPRDAQRFELPDNVSNGGLVQREADLAAFNWKIADNKFAGLRNTRVVEVVFSNPVSPYESHTLTVRDVGSVAGDSIVETSLPVTTTVTEPGGVVEGRVVGSDGLPVPFARVEVFESDARWVSGECIRHRTAATTADANGDFRFSYVRNGSCSDVYLLRGTDPESGRSGQAIGRIRLAGQVHALDVVMLGRGTVRGRVRYEDGTV